MIKGFDASHWDNIDWDNLSPDFKFVFLKGSQGQTYHDPVFQDNWKAARDKGLLHGEYGFWVPRINPQLQANNFLNRGVDWSLAGVLPPVIDIENQTDGSDKYILANKSECRDNALQLLEAVEIGAGKTPIVYCSPHFLQEYLGDSKPFAKYGLWIAGYQPTVPHLPDGFSNWVFWQQSEYGTQQGALTGGHLDIDWFNGDIGELNKLANL